jgi:hypothetical protein
MSETQRKALTAMAEQNVGALPVNGKWIFPEHVRQSESIAEIVLARLGGSR